MSDMKLIMENWRGYVNVLDSSLQQAELECDDAKSDTIYLIKENQYHLNYKFIQEINKYFRIFGL